MEVRLRSRLDLARPTNCRVRLGLVDACHGPQECVRHRALLAGVERASMEETAECPDTVGVLEAMAIDGPRCVARWMDAWSGGMLDAC